MHYLHEWVLQQPVDLCEKQYCVSRYHLLYMIYMYTHSVTCAIQL